MFFFKGVGGVGWKQGKVLGNTRCDGSRNVWSFLEQDADWRCRKSTFPSENETHLETYLSLMFGWMAGYGGWIVADPFPISLLRAGTTEKKRENRIENNCEREPLSGERESPVAGGQFRTTNCMIEGTGER